MPILTDIEEQMASMIAAMRKGDGYHYDWGSVNVSDKSLWTYPAALIYIDSEDNLDDNEGAWAQSYLQSCLFTIEVQTRLVEEYAQPLFEINKELNYALDDLKRLFGTNYSISGKCDLIMYRGMRRERISIGDMFIPKRMFTQWAVQYTQDRQDPSISAE